MTQSIHADAEVYLGGSRSVSANRLQLKQLPGFLWKNVKLKFFRPAQHGQSAADAHADFGQQTVQIVDTGDGLSFQSHDDVAITQSSALCRTSIFHRQHHCSGLFR